MRKKILIQLILFIIMLSNMLHAQQYFQFQTDSAQWNVYSRLSAWPPPAAVATYIYFINGDTIIDSKLYAAIYGANPDLQGNIDTISSYYLGGLREDYNKHIYYKPGEINQSISYQCYIDNPTLDEFLLYRFDLEAGETFYLNQYITIPYYVEQIDSVLVDSAFRKRFTLTGGLNDLGFDEWIEGVGSLWSLFGPHCINFEGLDYLMCYEDHSTFYFGSFNNSERCTDFIVGNIEKEKSLIKIYPNPAKDELYIAGNDSELIDIKIFNQLGQVILLRNKIKDKIDISMLSQGIYIIELNSYDFVIRKKIIVQ